MILVTPLMSIFVPDQLFSKASHFWKVPMDKQRRRKQQTTTGSTFEDPEVSSMKWEFINMSEEEEDLIYRMHKLLGDRWDLIAGRIPGRKAEEIERFWIMRHSQEFSSRR